MFGWTGTDTIKEAKNSRFGLSAIIFVANCLYIVRYWSVITNKRGNGSILIAVGPGRLDRLLRNHKGNVSSIFMSLLLVVQWKNR